VRIGKFGRNTALTVSGNEFHFLKVETSMKKQFLAPAVAAISILGSVENASLQPHLCRFGTKVRAFALAAASRR